MKILGLVGNRSLYTCNSYLLLGDWNRIEDVNTLVDPGVDGEAIVRELSGINTGVGKKPIDQVILTHGHFDHAAALPVLCEVFRPRVFALAPGPHVTHVIGDEDRIVCGDEIGEVVAAPGHSDDSLCLFFSESGALFTGDMPIRGVSPGEYGEEFIGVYRRLSSLPVKRVFPGHGPVGEGGLRGLPDEVLAGRSVR